MLPVASVGRYTIWNVQSLTSWAVAGAAVIAVAVFLYGWRVRRRESEELRNTVRSHLRFASAAERGRPGSRLRLVLIDLANGSQPDANLRPPLTGAGVL